MIIKEAKKLADEELEAAAKLAQTLINGANQKGKKKYEITESILKKLVTNDTTGLAQGLIDRWNNLSPVQIEKISELVTSAIQRRIRAN